MQSNLQSMWNSTLYQFGVFSKLGGIQREQKETREAVKENTKDINKFSDRLVPKDEPDDVKPEDVPEDDGPAIEPDYGDYSKGIKTLKDDYNLDPKTMKKSGRVGVFTADPNDVSPGVHETVDGKKVIHLPYEAGQEGKANFGYPPDDNTPAIRRELRLRAYDRYVAFVTGRMNQRNALEERYELLGGDL